MPVFDGKDHPGRPERGTVKLTVHVPRPLRDAFATAVRARGWKMAKGIRVLMEEVSGQSAGKPPVSGSARKLDLRLSDGPRAKLLEQAAARDTSPPAWARALLEAALLGEGRPVWGKRETAELRALYAELKEVERVTGDPAVLDPLRVAMMRVLNNLARLQREFESR